MLSLNCSIKTFTSIYSIRKTIFSCSHQEEQSNTSFLEVKIIQVLIILHMRSKIFSNSGWEKTGFCCAPNPLNCYAVRIGKYKPAALPFCQLFSRISNSHITQTEEETPGLAHCSCTVKHGAPRAFEKDIFHVNIIQVATDVPLHPI